jgi:hypothetical protein
VSSVHDVRQAPAVPHMYGAHDSVAAAQLPVAHVPASVRVAVPAWQAGAEHAVAAG